MVNVTTDALKTVKDALSDFITDVEGIASRAESRLTDTMNTCNAHISKTKGDIVQSELKIAALGKSINQAEEKIQSITNELNFLAVRMPELMNNIHALGSQIAELESQIAALQAQLSNCDDQDQYEQIQSQIDILQSRVNQSWHEKKDSEDELRNAENKRVELLQQLDTTKSQKAQLESAHSTEKNRCNKLKDKLERLKMAYNRVELDLREYVSAAKNFEVSTSDSAQMNTSAVEKCIVSIEEYLKTSI